MNKKLGRIFVYGIAGMLLFSVKTAHAYKDDNGEGRRRINREEIAAKIAEKLNLSEEQSKQLRAKRTQHRDRMKELRSALKGKRSQLQEELEKVDSDEGKIRSMASEIKALQAQLVDHRIEGILRTKEILTPEQFSKLQSMKQEWAKKRGKKGFRKGKGFGGNKGF